MELALEPARLRALQSLEVLDTAPEADLDALAADAARLCGAPIALVSLVDHDRQFFKAHVGIGITEAPRPGSFCNAAILGPGLFEVSDGTRDPRFLAHPMVVGEPRIRFYAGMPLISRERAALGTLCVIDFKPRHLSATQRDGLEVLGRITVETLQRRREHFARQRAREALERDVLQRLRSVMARAARLDAPAGEVFALLRDAEEASQCVADAAALLRHQETHGLLRRRCDLTALVRSLAEALSEAPGARAIAVSASGDGAGLWDEDQLSEALAALLEETAPARATIRGAGNSVELLLEGSAPQRERSAGACLRLELARSVIESHGGWLLLQATGAALGLPRSFD